MMEPPNTRWVLWHQGRNDLESLWLPPKTPQVMEAIKDWHASRHRGRSECLRAKQRLDEALAEAIGPWKLWKRGG
jgi:hypothetical protein